MKSIVLFTAVLCLASLFAMANDERRYPQEALQCYASSALQSQKEGKIICPQGSQVRTKEVVNATSRADCGTVKGTHFGRDVWDVKLAQCVYRKCSSSCPSSEEDRARLFGGNGENGVVTSSKLLGGLPTLLFNRTSYCCDTNLCNQAFSRCPMSLLISFVVFAVGIVAF